MNKTLTKNNILIGVILLTLFTYLALNTLEPVAELKSYPTTVATVVDVQKVKLALNNSQRDYWCYIYEYEVNNVTYTDSYASLLKQRNIGDIIEIHYKPTGIPTSYYLDSLPIYLY